MLLAITHKSTTCKGEDATYIYTIQDDNEDKPRDIKFSMPLSLVIQTNSLETIALHQAYGSQGRAVMVQVLNQHYALLAKEGNRNQREQDIAFYRRIFG